MNTAGHGKRVTALLAHVLGEQQDLGLTAGVHLSRSGLHRAFLRCFGESPAALRRRLLLEQAAWTLSNTAIRVTDLAFDCDFGSLEGFTRAFRRAYGVSPSLYRRGLHGSHDLPAPSGIHFRPEVPGRPADARSFMHRQSFVRIQEEHMDILEHLLGFDQRFMQRALTLARQLPEGALDRPLGQTQALDFEAPDRTLRDLLDKQVFTKEVWLSAVRGGVMPPEDRSRSLDGLLARLELAYPAFLELAQEVQRQARWREQFTDALCEPAEQFPYGGMLAHVLSLDAHRRHMLSAWFAELGVRLQADPMHFAAEVPVIR